MQAKATATYELTVDGRGGAQATFATLADALAFAGSESANITMRISGTDDSARKLTLGRNIRLFCDGDLHVILGSNQPTS